MCGGIAQLVEQAVHTRCVGGSNPSPATIYIENLVIYTSLARVVELADTYV